MPEASTETPVRFKKARDLFGRLSKGSPHAATTPELATQERLLPANLFQINEAETRRSRSLVLNPEAVKKGLPAQHLVEPDETVVTFTGSLPELAEFIAQTQQAPLRGVDMQPYQDVGASSLLRRTGVEIISSFPAPQNELLAYPEGETRAALRSEIVGIETGEGGSTLFLMRGRHQKYPIPEPGHFPEGTKDRKDVEDFYLSKSNPHGTNFVELAIEHPVFDPMSQMYIAQARDSGEVMFLTSSRVGNTGYETTNLHVQKRKPSPDLRISDTNVSTFISESNEEMKSVLSRIVVPARITSGLAPSPAPAK